jgi:hypothetical protein
MPIDPTPAAQVVEEPAAINCTGDATVVPGPGLDTVTVANAWAAKASTMRGT